MSAGLMNLLGGWPIGKSYRLLTDIIQFHRYNGIISFLRAV